MPECGRDILERQEREGWGTKVIERLARDLRTEFPDMKGFSRTNLMYMRSFTEAWDSEEMVVQRLVGQPFPFWKQLPMAAKATNAIFLEVNWNNSVFAKNALYKFSPDL